MLEGLDQIDWASLSHSYGSAENTPQYIRMLVSDNLDHRNAAYNHLIGAVNHQGDVMSATAAVVPFLIELVTHETTPEREHIIYVLNNFVDSTSEHLLRVQYESYEVPFGEFRHEIDTYINVSAGIEVFLSLLQQETKVRDAVGLLLGKLVDHKKRSIPVLWQAFKHETDTKTQLVLLQSFQRLVRRYPLDETLTDAITYMESLVKSHQPLEMRLEAAMILVEFSTRDIFRPRNISEQVITTLIEALEQHFVRFDVLETVNRLGIDGMARALKLKTVNKDTAHIIARSMLDKVFDGRGKPTHLNFGSRWKDYEVYGGLLWKFTGNYTLPKLHKTYVPEKELTREQKLVLKEILACEPFWKMKTNLFTFFYGLPDDRKKLQELVNRE